MGKLMKQAMRRSPSNTSEGVKLVSVRVPVATHERLVLAAAKDKRSVNGQINLLIEQHLEEFEAETREAA